MSSVSANNTTGDEAPIIVDRWDVITDTKTGEVLIVPKRSYKYNVIEGIEPEGFYVGPSHSNYAFEPAVLVCFALAAFFLGIIVGAWLRRHAETK